MLVVFLCCMMKIVEMTSGPRNVIQQKLKPPRPRRRRRGVNNGGAGKDMAELVCGGPISPRSPDSDCNSNHTGGAAPDHCIASCLSNASQDMDFIQDNSDYQWFLDYGYRESGIHQHTSVLSSLSASYTGVEELGYYDALSKNLDANLAEADMESFRTEDIHSLLTTLPAMCIEMQIVQESNREGEMYASMSGSLLEKLELESSMSPHMSSQEEVSAGSIDTMSICKSELLFSPVKETPMPGHNYSVDSLDCELPNEQDIMLTCQANKNNYTIAFEGSVTMFSEENDEHDQETTTRNTNNWPLTTTSEKMQLKKITLDSSMAKSDLGFTTWSKLKKRSSETQLRRHPSGNNNTTTDHSGQFGVIVGDTMKSQSLPNLSKQKNRYLSVSTDSKCNNVMSSSSIDSYSHIQRFPLGCIKVFDIQHQTTSGSMFSDITSSIDGGDSSCSDRHSMKVQTPNFNLVKRFMKQKSISADGMSSGMDKSSASDCCHSGISAESYEDRQRNIKLYSSVNDNHGAQCDNKPYRQINHHTSNWLPAEELVTENSTCAFEDSLVEQKLIQVIYRTHDLIEEESEDRISEQPGCVEVVPEHAVSIDALNINKLKAPKGTPQLCNINNNNSIDRCENIHYRELDEIHTKKEPVIISSAESASISMCSSSEGTETTKFQRYSPFNRGRRNKLKLSPLAHIDKSMQTSVLEDLNDEPKVDVKIIEPSFLNKLKDGDMQQPVYVCYPNYTLPDLDFLKETEDSISKVLLMPQKFVPTTGEIPPEADEKPSHNSRRPFSCNDVEMLKKKGFGHVKDWDSLTFLLPMEYRQILAEVPEVVQQIKNKEEDLLKQKERPLFCVTPPMRHKVRPQSCDFTGMLDRTIISSSSSTATQPSSGYRGSSTILLTDSVQNSNPPTNNFNPLFIYRYDSVTSSEASLLTSEKQRSGSQVPPLPKRSISLPNGEQKPVSILRKADTIPPRPPLPKSILRKSMELCKQHKNYTNSKRYSMFEMGDNDDGEKTNIDEFTKRKSVHDPYYLYNQRTYSTTETDESYADEGVDAGTDSSVETYDRLSVVRPPTPPLPKTNESVFLFPSVNNVSQDELVQLEDFLKQSGISCSDSDEWNDNDMLKLRSHVSKFLSLKINQSRCGRRSVSFSDRVTVYLDDIEAGGKPGTNPPRPYQCMGLVDMPICEEGESSPEGRSSPPMNFKAALDIEQKTALISAVTDSVEQIIHHFSPALGQSDLNLLGNSSQTPSCAKLILGTLCPALYAILSDGLKPNLETSFGIIGNTVWQVIEGSSQNGPLTKSLNDLVLRINGEDVITEGLVKFNAFVFGLLNVQSLDAWLGYLRTRETILRKHYNPDALLLMAHTSGTAIRNLMDTLVSCLQPLSMLPFQIELMFEYRQLHLSLKRMEALQQAGRPTHFRLSPVKPQITNKQWALMKIVRSIQSSFSQSETSEPIISPESREQQLNATDGSISDLLNSSTQCKTQVREEKQRPRSYVDATNVTSETPPHNIISDITSTVKKRWSNIHLGSKLYQAFDRLAAEDTEEEYTDSLEPEVNKINHLREKAKDSSADETHCSGETSDTQPESIVSEEKTPLNGGKFRRLQMKWEMLSGKEVTSTSSPSSPTDSPAHTPGSTGSGKSRIPRLVPSPVRANSVLSNASLPKSTGSKIATLPSQKSAPLLKRQGTETKLPISTQKSALRKSGVPASTRTSRVDQHENASEGNVQRPHPVRPSSLPYRPTEQQLNKNSKITPPRRAVSSSVHKSSKTTVKSTSRMVRTLSHRLPADNGHLSFNEGERLKVVLEVDDKWLLCCRGDQKGLVPRSAVIAISVDIGHRF